MAVRQYGEVEEMPPEHHALRIGGDPDDSILKHWTGPVGKEEIRRQMSGAEQYHTKPHNRLALLERLPKGGVVAEIGVLEAKFSRMIYDTCEPRKLHLIDPWKWQPDEKYSDPKNAEQDVQDKRYAVARLNMQGCAGVHFHRLMSHDAVSRFANGELDWAYIDGNHGYDVVKKDLELYAPKIKSGGLLCGHDYADLYECGGVKRAVDEVCQEHGWVMTMCTTDRWPSFALKRKGE